MAEAMQGVVLDPVVIEGGGDDEYKDNSDVNRLNTKFVLRLDEVMGRELVAGEDIVQGEIVVVESPIQISEFGQELFDFVTVLNDEERAHVLDCYCPSLEANSFTTSGQRKRQALAAMKEPWAKGYSLTTLHSVLMIFDANAHSWTTSRGTKGRALLRWGSKINHSCTPNVRYSSERVPGLAIHFALSPIAKGTRLLSNYLDGTRSTRCRRKQLLATKGFFCVCPLCKEQPDLNRAVPCVQCHPLPWFLLPERRFERLKWPAIHFAVRLPDMEEGGEGQWECESCGASMTDAIMFPVQEELEDEEREEDVPLGQDQKAASGTNTTTFNHEVDASEARQGSNQGFVCTLESELEEEVLRMDADIDLSGDVTLSEMRALQDKVHAYLGPLHWCAVRLRKFLLEYAITLLSLLEETNTLPAGFFALDVPTVSEVEDQLMLVWHYFDFSLYPTSMYFLSPILILGMQLVVKDRYTPTNIPPIFKTIAAWFYVSFFFIGPQSADWHHLPSNLALRQLMWLWCGEADATARLAPSAAATGARGVHEEVLELLLREQADRLLAMAIASSSSSVCSRTSTTNTTTAAANKTTIGFVSSAAKCRQVTRAKLWYSRALLVRETEEGRQGLVACASLLSRFDVF